MEKGKMAEKNWKTVAKRIFANFLFVLLLVASAYGVIVAVERSKQEPFSKRSVYVYESKVKFHLKRNSAPKSGTFTWKEHAVK